MNRNTRRSAAVRRGSSRSSVSRRSSGLSRGQFITRAGVGAAGVGAAMMGMSGAARAAKTSPRGLVKNCVDLANGHTLKDILARGKLRAAVAASDTPGFFVNGEGIEADFARALARAIFGPSGDDKVEWVYTNSATRFSKVVSGHADVCFRTCTWTATRDAYQGTIGTPPVHVNAGVAFAPVYFYDGLDVLVNEDKAPQGTPLSSMRIGVQNPSTTYDVLSLPIAEGGAFGLLDAGTSGPGLVSYSDKNPRTLDFQNGLLDAMAGDGSDVAAYSTSSTYLFFSDGPDGKPYGKEPLAPFVAEGDDNWRDIVTWVMFALFQGYEIGGVPDGTSIGPLLGLSPDWAVHALQDGNYGELFEDSFGIPPGGKNKLWTEDGLIYSPAFR